MVFVAVAVPLEANETLEGGVQLELSAPHVQPAQLRLPVVLVSADSLTRPGSPPGVNSVVGRGRWPEVGAPFSRDLLVVAGAVAAVVVGSALLLVVVKCVTDRRQRTAGQGAAGPPDLARTLQRRPSRDSLSGGLQDSAAHGRSRDQNSETMSDRSRRRTPLASQKCGDSNCSMSSLDRARVRSSSDSASDANYSVSASPRPRGSTLGVGKMACMHNKQIM